MTTCVPALHDGIQSNEGLTEEKVPLPQADSSETPQTMSDVKQNPQKEDGTSEFDLTYITERIIVWLCNGRFDAMSYPAEGVEEAYHNEIKEVARMLHSKHADNYRIINLSEHRYDMTRLNEQVLDFGWPDNLSPPLERLCSICKSIDSWLNSDPHNVVVIHCKGGKGRTGMVIAAYLHYSNICASADQALDRFAMKRFYDDKLSGATQPSQRRYVHYFAGLLSGAIKINSSAMYLHHIVIHGIPNFDGKGGCRPFVKIYQGLQPLFTSGVYTVTENVQRVCISMSQGLQLRGDIMIKCYHKKPKSSSREVIFRCQFHTCTVSDSGLLFGKKDLDDACTDLRFPDYGCVELIFSSAVDRSQVQALLTDPHTAAEESMDPLVHWDSYENFNNLDTVEGGIITHSSKSVEESNAVESSFQVMQVPHKEGPVDGSLYAKVCKKNSPLKNGAVPNLQNGPLTNSFDSGISTTSGQQRTVHTHTTTNATTDLTNQSDQTSLLEEHRKLDQILSELLGDDMLTAPQSSTSSRTVMSWQTSENGTNGNFSITGRTLSPVDLFANPTTKQTATTTMEKREYSYTPSTGHQTSEEVVTRTYDSGDNKEAILYQPEIKEIRTRQEQEPVHSPPPPPVRTHGPISSSPLISPMAPPRSHSTLPYKVSYDNPDSVFLSGYHSDSDQPLTWLQQQQMKLRAKKEGRDPFIFQVHEAKSSSPQPPQRTEQERLLVRELKSAQSKMLHRRAQSEADAEEVLREYYPQRSGEPLQNGTSHAIDIPLSQSDTRHTSESYKTEKNYFVSGLERPPFTTSQTQYTFSVSPPQSGADSHNTENAYGAIMTHKPPPGPAVGRSSAPTSPVIPTRSTSKGLVERSRATTTTTREWATHGRPLARQRSDTSFDRDVTQGMGFKQPSMQNSYQYNPSSQFQTYNTMPAQKSADALEDSVVRQMASQQNTSISTKLDELEKSLQAAMSQSSATVPRRQSGQSANSGYESEELQSRRTESFGTDSRHTGSSFESQQTYSSGTHSNYQRSGSPEWDNVKDKDTVDSKIEEEEHFSLRPIGRGVQNVDPTTTEWTPTTPAFPVQGISSTSNQQFVTTGNQLPVATVTYCIDRDDSHIDQSVSPQQPVAQQFIQQVPPAQTASQQQMAKRTDQRSYTIQQQQQQKQLGAAQSMGGAQGIQAAQPNGFIPYSVQQQGYATLQPHQQSHMREQSSAVHSGFMTLPTQQQQQRQQQIQQQQQQQQQQIQQQQQQQQQIQQQQQQQQIQQQQQQQQQHVQFMQHAESSSSASGKQQELTRGGISSTPIKHQISPQLSPEHQRAPQMSPIQQQVPQLSPHGHQVSFQQDGVQTQHQQEALHSQSFGSSSSGHAYSTISYESEQGLQNGGVQDSLTVDTSHRMLSANMPRSPSSGGSQAHSPISPGNINTLRTNFSSSSASHAGSLSPGAAHTHVAHSQGSSLSSLTDGMDYNTLTPRFVKDTSKFWYKANISREQAIHLLKDKPPGTFVVRDSNSFPGAFGLAVKVAQVPPNVQTKANSDPASELVRHFLIEPTPKGVKLKGCSNEPVFGSLAALVYQHSITPLALPCKLYLPETEASYREISMPDSGVDTVDAKVDVPTTSAAVLSQGAACNVLFLNTVDTESLTGPQAVAKAMKETFAMNPLPKTTVVHFKVSSQGITLTDNNRKLFFRRHYPVNTVTYCGMDPDDRRWTQKNDSTGLAMNAKIFGFVARKQNNAVDNSCHLFAELDPEQPANAIVSFVTKVMIGHHGHGKSLQK